MHHQENRMIRGYQAPFMAKELVKKNMEISKSKNLYSKWTSREYFLAYKSGKKMQQHDHIC